jgi:PleD family two-component response regulator
MAFAPGLSAEQAMRMGQMMAERVRALRIHHPRCAVLRYMSVSVGVGAMVPGANDKPTVLIETSQRHLQLAKQSGRNRAA